VQAASGAAGYTQADYERAGIGRQYAQALAGAGGGRCEPNDFKRRAAEVHGPGGRGGRCDDDVIGGIKCENSMTCAANQRVKDLLTQRITARARRDHCYGGADPHHDGTINRELSNRVGKCTSVTAQVCR
jgi:hypothetical protein